MSHGKVRPWHYLVGVVLLGVVVLIWVWNWDWFIPIVDRFASARLGHPVTIQHLHVRIAANPVLEADDVVVGNPPGFPASEPLAHIDRLAVMLDGPAYLHGQAIVVPSIEVDKPTISAIALPDKRNNWTFPFSGAPSGGKPGSSARIGDLKIVDGHVHAVVPALKADFHLDIATRDAAEGHPSQLLVDARGTYANQPITGHFAGGALLTIRDKNNPYPVDLTVENGPTKIVLRGTVQDPLAFAGTQLKLDLTGQDMANLTPLTGVPIPATKPFSLSGKINYADKRIRLDDLVGRVGKTDMEGTVAMDPGPERPVVDIDIRSHRVDLADFAGLIGSSPNSVATPGSTPQQQAEVRKAAASPYLIPRTPIDLPRLKAADINLKFHGEHIEGRFVPLDNVVAEATVKDGAIRANPISFGVGHGHIVADLAADPRGDHGMHARASVDFRQVDVARLMAATHTFGGGGSIGGKAVVEGAGESIGGILGAGNGEIKLFMSGGNLSALLVDLSGLEFGNALITALSLPKKAEVRCLVADLALRDGLLDTRTMVLDTTEANVIGKGTINLRDEVLNYQLRTEAKHFTIGSLPAPIDITGHLKSPSIRPNAKDVAIRGGIAAGLGVLLTPLAALLPTIQLGLGENNNCGELIRTARGTPDPADQHGAAENGTATKPGVAQP